MTRRAPASGLRRARQHPRPPHMPTRRAERMLQALGVDAAFAEDVLGDLIEEYALRREREGSGAARVWVVGEGLRSAPHVVRSALRTLSLHGPARVVGSVMGLAIASFGAVAALQARKGPPAYLVAGVTGAGDRIVVSTRRPVQLPMRVFDADGDVLAATGVRYSWESGAPASVAPDGVVRCSGRGDAVVRAALGPLVTRVVLSCQPVRWLHMRGWYNFTLGDPAQAMRVGAIGLDGAPVSRLAADVRVEDPSVATFERTPEGMRIRPLAPGRTRVHVSAGGRHTGTAVTVFEPVSTLEGLRPEQRYVLASTRLAARTSVRWPLPLGRFWLVNQVDGNGDAPALAVAGPVTCVPAPGPGVYRTRCSARGSGASVTLAHPGPNARALDAVLALERDDPLEPDDRR